MSSNNQSTASTSNELSQSHFENCNIYMNSGDVINKIPPNKEIIPSIQNLKKVQVKFEQEGYLLDIPESSYHDIQNIFPQMREARISERDTVTTKELYVPSQGISSLSNDMQLPNAKELSIDDLLAETRKYKILNLIGLPGAGKSTICRRMVKRICKDPNSVCILVKFMNLNYSFDDQKLTLQELLIDHNYPELEEHECKSAFQWIVENEDKLLLILDGYDQANWFMKENSPQVNYHKPQPVCDLVTNIYKKKYLPECCVLLTSRPHAVVTLPKSLRKNLTVHLLDLLFDDVKKLFFVFAGSRAELLWDTLHAAAPQLLNLCGSPLLLQLVIIACASPTTNIGSITTLTRLFASILVNLNASDHSIIKDIRTVLPALMELAHNLTKSKTVMMNKEDIREVGLDLSTVHHLIISQQSRDPLCLFEGKTPLFFIHQTLQEYLTALYIKKLMCDEDFARFVRTDLFSSHWTVVRQFLFGITFDLHENPGIHQWKIDLMREQLLLKFEENPEDGDLIELCSCVRECADDDVIRQAAEKFPTEASMRNTPISNSDAHALSLVLKKVRGRVEMLNLSICNLTSDSFRFIADAIKASACLFDVINIGLNRLSPTDVTIIGDIMDKVNVRLWMHDCFVDGDGGLRNATEAEEGIIQQRLNTLENWDLVVWDGRKTLRKTV